MVNSTAKAVSSTLTDQATKVTSKTELSKARDATHGPTETIMKVHGSWRRCKVLESMSGKMARFMRVTGLIVRFMDKVACYTLTEASTQDDLLTDRARVKARLKTLMAQSTKASGLTIKCMVRVN